MQPSIARDGCGRTLARGIGAPHQPIPQSFAQGKRHGVFHVENALGSPYIPAQQEFVIRHGIKSVLGFGGLLYTGDLFAVILFSTVHVPESAADRFRTIALDVKSAFSRFNEANVFNQAIGSAVGPASATTRNA